MANITTDTYQKKTWTANDVVTAEDLNHIENGITANNTGLIDVQGRATSLESRAASLEGRATSLESRASAHETKDASLESQVNSLNTQMNDKSTGALARIEALKNDAVLQSNFARQIEPHLTINYTKKMSLNGIRLQIERKNPSRSTFKYAFYKRTSTGELSISKTFSTPESQHVGYKDYVFDIATLDSGTNDMESGDIALFASVSKVSGVGSYNTSFKIENNVLKFVASVLGGGIFNVYLTFSVGIYSRNDDMFISY